MKANKFIVTQNPINASEVGMKSYTKKTRISQRRRRKEKKRSEERDRRE
jgi:hypothetical protein